MPNNHPNDEIPLIREIKRHTMDLRVNHFLHLAGPSLSLYIKQEIDNNGKPSHERKPNESSIRYLYFKKLFQEFPFQGQLKYLLNNEGKPNHE